MKFIKIFEDFKDIDSICQEFGIKNYTINNDGSIDVNGDVNLNSKGLVKLPLRFREVSGDFYCNRNQLTSLEGSPQTVGGDFYCRVNNLTSLEGSPKKVGSSFDCSYNRLNSLEGSPQSIGGSLYCHENKLTNLVGSPQTVGVDFVCRDNPVENIWHLFSDYSKVELFNDYDPIRDNRVIILDRLNSFLQDIGKPEVTRVKGYKCI